MAGGDAAAGAGRALGKRRWYRPRVTLVEEPGGGRTVLKDFGPCPFPWRWTYGWLLTAREARAYARLDGVPGVPRWRGRRGRLALAVEFVEGKDLGKCRAGSLDAAVFDRLRATVEEMHRRGVLHLDLRQRRNVIVPADRVPRVLDFSSGFTVAPGGFLGRRLLRWLGPVDVSGVLKYKQRFLPGSLTPEEAETLRRVGRWRRWWVFS